MYLIAMITEVALTQEEEKRQNLKKNVVALLILNLQYLTQIFL